ncbi:exosortase/archaeosortase family protein [Saccharothrix tamanrassetensis]|uniref:Exosortase/archaeosortase family protein n=1 Tax=Saccharothrix tamanrassetensis TaxID=1051531 RepID=A0A841CJ94_9PSEU|nr:exosortase P [Saccharothrix tamanrassetensis]MBB5957521.1 exosortase/archaeosortase family protein [Saccharothrix tamanrassetensis]
MAFTVPRTDHLDRVIVVALVVAAGGLVLAHRAYRTAEIALSGLVLGVLDHGGVAVVADRQTVYFGLGSDTPLGLRMTPECTSAFLVVPLLLVGAAMIALRPRITRRVLVALAAATAAVVVVNQFRVLSLVGLVRWLGVDTGYYWGHTLLGSVVSVLGGAAALVAFVRLATRR